MGSFIKKYWFEIIYVGACAGVLAVLAYWQGIS